MDEECGAPAGPKLPALPADGVETGVLPRVIRNLVERRAVVKKMLKKEKVRACRLYARPAPVGRYLYRSFLNRSVGFVCPRGLRSRPSEVWVS